MKGTASSNMSHVLYSSENPSETDFGSAREGETDQTQAKIASIWATEERSQEDIDGDCGRPQGSQSGPNLSPERWAELEATVRRDEKGRPTSIGSEAHGTACKACLFVFTGAGCDRGVACTFCHFKHKRGDGPRPCKSKRNRYRKLAEHLGST